MDWKKTDERLIRRGELILDPTTLKNHVKELETMNKGRIGRPYTLSNGIIQLLTAIRYLYGLPYRQLEGFTRALHTLVPDMPTGDYSSLRKRILGQPIDPYRHLAESSDPVTIAVDSTGIKVEKAGGWVERKHGKKKRYVKLHFAVNTVTHEVVAMEISTNDMHDVRRSPGWWRRRRGTLGWPRSSVTAPTTPQGSIVCWRTWGSAWWLSRGGTGGVIGVIRVVVGRWSWSGAWAMRGGLS